MRVVRTASSIGVGWLAAKWPGGLSQGDCRQRESHVRQEVLRSETATWAALTGRRPKPGAYDGWRRAWLPEGMRMPAGMTAYILRKAGDPDEVIAFGMFEGTADELEALRPDPAEEEARVAGMAPFVESVFADGLYEVVEVVRG